jgi:haloacetate dehalogenase
MSARIRFHTDQPGYGRCVIFDGFRLDTVDVGDVTLRVRHGGDGPAVVLLHGHPRTHTTWLAVLDTVPIGAALARCDAIFARAWWHWFFFGQSAKPAERVINADPDAWYTATEEQLGVDNYADFRRAVHNPDTVHAMLEDYRAGLGIDRAHDHADRAAGRMIGCPTLVLWALRDDLGNIYGDVAAVWRPWARDVTVEPFDSGHHMAEERPEELAGRLAAFLAT